MWKKFQIYNYIIITIIVVVIIFNYTRILKSLNILFYFWTILLINILCKTMWIWIKFTWREYTEHQHYEKVEEEEKYDNPTTIFKICKLK